MNPRDLISIEGCAVEPELPDFYVKDGFVVPGRRSERGRIFRAEARHHLRWSAVLIVFLLVMLCVQRVLWEDMKAERDQAREALEAVQRPAVMVSCTLHAETPAADTVVHESCIGVRYRF